MFGALFGDIAGSVYEFRNTHDYDFELLTPYSRPTDDSCMTLAVANALMDTAGKDDSIIRSRIVYEMQKMGKAHPDAGYGGSFYRWIFAEHPKPYGSWGNGSAMRVSSCGWLYETMEQTLHAAELSAAVSHDHPEGIKGAKAVAAAVFLARNGSDKKEIREYIESSFGYDLHRTLAEIMPAYTFDVSCQGSVPEAIIAFMEGESFEDTIRKAVILGGDSDTIACMAGAIAEAYYGFDERYRQEVLKRLDETQKEILIRFEKSAAAYGGK